MRRHTTFLFLIFLSGCAEINSLECDIGGYCPNLPPKFHVDPELGLAFENTALGHKASRSIIVSNRGGGQLGLESISLSEGSSQDFKIAGSFMMSASHPFLLAAGQSLEIVILYEPSDGVEDTGNIELEWSEFSSKTKQPSTRHNIPLRSPVLGERSAKVMEKEINFGYVPVGRQLIKTLHVFNNSPSATTLTISSTSVSDNAPFVIDLFRKYNINPNESVPIPVIFSPSTQEVYDVEGLIYINGLKNPLTLRLLGTSLAGPRVSVREGKQSEMAFGSLRVGTSTKKSFRIRNEGSETLALSCSLKSTPPDSFELLTPETGVSKIGPMEVFEVVVNANPLEGGEMRGTLKITDTENNSIVNELHLSAFGISPQIRVTPSLLSFKPNARGWPNDMERIAIMNQGIGELIIEDISLSPDSSPLITLSNLPNLPLKLGSEDEALIIGVNAFGYEIGDINAAILIKSNSIDKPLLTIPVSAQTQSCEDYCNPSNATSECIHGRCEIQKCDRGWHDADRLFTSGCECPEDFPNREIGGTCSGNLQIGWLGDSCSNYDKLKTEKGTLHDQNDIDVFFARIEDKGSMFCDFFGDSFLPSISLEAPPEMVLCVNKQPSGSGCGGYSDQIDPNICGQNYYEFPGSYGSEDSSDITAWVVWRPGSAPICGEYQIIFRGNAA